MRQFKGLSGLFEPAREEMNDTNLKNEYVGLKIRHEAGHRRLGLLIKLIRATL